MPGQVVVAFERGAGAERRAGARRAIDASVNEHIEPLGAQLLTLAPGRSIGEAIRSLEARPEVRYAEPNYLFELDATPNDPLFGDQWGLFGPAAAGVDAQRAWDLSRGSVDVLVAVADAGVDLRHADFGGPVSAGGNVYVNPGESGAAREHNHVDDDGNGYVDDVSGYDFSSGNPNPNDYAGHGSHAASVAFARGDDGVGLTGVAQRVSMMSIKTRDQDYYSTSAGVAEGFAYAGQEGVRVVSASMGAPNGANVVNDAIRSSAGTLFVFTAGNDSRDVDASTYGRFPCTSPEPNVLCVAATDRSGSMAGFSNWGSRSVDLGAPGVDILGAHPTKSTRYFDDFSQELAGRWTVGGGPGPWTRQTEGYGRPVVASYPAGRSWSPGSPAVSADTTIELDRGFDLRGGSSCRVWYLADAMLESGQRVDVEASAGAGPWERVGTFGFWESWRSDDLSRFDGREDVRLRFRLSGTTFQPYDGAYVADLNVHCLQAGAAARLVGGGTSSAVPHVSGAAALVAARRPNASALELKAAILAGVDPDPSLAGRTVSGGRLNAYGALLGHRAPAVPAPTSAPATVRAGAQAPARLRCRLLPRRGQRLRAFARRGYSLTVRCNKRARLSARVNVSRRIARRLGLLRHSRTLARSAGAAATTRRLVLRPSLRSRRRLAGLMRLSASLLVVAHRPGTAAHVASRSLRWRR